MEGIVEEHVYHHLDDAGPRVNVKLEKNSRGFNWEVTVLGAKSIEHAAAMLAEAEAKMTELYGEAK